MASILIRAGFERARWSKSSRVKGWGKWFKGFNFKVESETELRSFPVPRSRRRWRNGVCVSRPTELREVPIKTKWIEVTHIVGDWYKEGRDPSPEEMLKKYQAALDAAGYRAQLLKQNNSFGTPYLMVNIWKRERFVNSSMMRYEDACKLIDAMEAAGVPANIVPGGIGFYPATRAAEHVMYEVSAKFGQKPEMGMTMHEENVIMLKVNQ